MPLDNSPLATFLYCYIGQCAQLKNCISQLRSHLGHQLGCCCSAAQSCRTLWEPMDCSTSGSPVLHYLHYLSLLKLMSMMSVMLSNLLNLCCLHLLFPSIFPSIRVFSNESVLRIRGQGIVASASVLSVNIQGWFPLGLTGWISSQSKGLSRVFSNTTVRRRGSLVCCSPWGRKESDMTYRLNNKQLIKISVQFLKVTFHLQLRHNVGSFPRVVQYILELILHPIVCTFHFPTTSNH